MITKDLGFRVDGSVEGSVELRDFFKSMGYVNNFGYNYLGSTGCYYVRNGSVVCESAIGSQKKYTTVSMYKKEFGGEEAKDCRKVDGGVLGLGGQAKPLTEGVAKYPKVPMRSFETGATRNIEEGKLDYEGFLSPTAIEAFAEYMNKNRTQADGNIRDSDNWQKGMPLDVYMKSMYRHFFDSWKNHRKLKTEEDHVTNLCALMFNVQGYLHELLKLQQTKTQE